MFKIFYAPEITFDQFLSSGSELRTLLRWNMQSSAKKYHMRGMGKDIWYVGTDKILEWEIEFSGHLAYHEKRIKMTAKI